MIEAHSERTDHNVALGTGAVEIPQFLREMYRLQIKPSLMTVDGTGSTVTIADLSHSFDELEKALQPIMAQRVDEISRTTASRRAPNLMTDEERQKIDAALPTQAPAKPKKPRKLLVS